MKKQSVIDVFLKDYKRKPVFVEKTNKQLSIINKNSIL